MNDEPFTLSLDWDPNPKPPAKKLIGITVQVRRDDGTLTDHFYGMEHLTEEERDEETTSLVGANAIDEDGTRFGTIESASSFEVKSVDFGGTKVGGRRIGHLRI